MFPQPEIYKPGKVDAGTVDTFYNRYAVTL